MKHILSSIIFVSVLGLASNVSPSAQEPGATGTSGAMPLTARASLKDAEGRGVGEAVLQQTPHGVLLTLDLKNTTPGIHALHIHQVGLCQAPSFDSAGGHFAPSGHEHGFLNAGGPHEGDLPNLTVPSTRELSIDYLVTDVTLDAGPRSLFDADGSSLVIHAGKDDYKSNPAGAAGERLACGVIVH